MSARRMTPDPLKSARAFADEAERARGDWRTALLHNARSKVDDARAALVDNEKALHGRSAVIARLMGNHIEARRREIDRVATRINELEGMR
jgi:hypothetical protein